MTERVTAAEFRKNGKGKKRSKYGNVKTRGYDSAKEAKRADELALLEKAGEITNLRSQVDFSLAVNGEHVAIYRADFVYECNGRRVVEDVKGFRTEVYRIKRKLMLVCHGIVVMEV